MNLIRISDGEYPRSIWQVREENPNVSFPANPSDEDLDPYDHANVHPIAPPDVEDPRSQRVEDSGRPVFHDGCYQQAWRVRDATDEEIAAWDRDHAPMPEWREFAVALIMLPEISLLLTSLALAPSRALEAALSQVANGAEPQFLIELLQRIPMPPKLATGIGKLAVQHHLPSEFILALSLLESAQDSAP